MTPVYAGREVLFKLPSVVSAYPRKDTHQLITASLLLKDNLTRTGQPTRSTGCSFSVGNVVVLGQSGAIPEGAFAELTLNQQWIVSWRGALCGASKFHGDLTSGLGTAPGASETPLTTGLASFLGLPSIPAKPRLCAFGITIEKQSSGFTTA